MRTLRRNLQARLEPETTGRECCWRCLAISKWIQERTDAAWEFSLLTISMSTVILTEMGPRLELRSPDQPDMAPAEFILGFTLDWIILLPYSGELREFVSVQLSVRNANRFHPLAKVMLESRWLEEKSGLQKFADSLLYRLADLRKFELPRYQRWQKKIGHLYRGVNWEGVASEFRPPYKVLTSTGEVMFVTHDTLESWADTPLSKVE